MRPLPSDNDKDDLKKRCRIREKGGSDARYSDDYTSQGRPNGLGQIEFNAAELSSGWEIVF
jgi:hypothetical protein